jgi:hypothetical protein
MMNQIWTNVPQLRVCLLAVASMALHSVSPAQITYSPDPAALLRQMYFASGGDHWSKVVGANLTGNYDMGGLKGSFHQLIDFQHGRDVLTYDVGTTRGKQGTEQTMSWWTDDKGLTTVQQTPDAMADAATESYMDRNGWFYPDSHSSISYEGQHNEKGGSFDLVRIAPPSGRALTLWIDQTTHFLARVIEVDSKQRENITYLSDYRQVAGVWYPFLQRSSTGDPSSDVTMIVTSFDKRMALTDRDFDPPPSIVHDARLLTNSDSATVPFSLKDGMIVVNVSLNGAKPLPFVLDSGAFNVLTPETAKLLNLAAGGNVSVNGVGNSQMSMNLARVQTYRVGEAELSNQTVFVLSLPRSFTDNGRHDAIAGLIGYEILRRFTVRIDYHRRELTFSLPGNVSQHAHGEKLPLLFDGRDCFVEGKIGDSEGYFGIDTGDDGSITLFKSFYISHNIPIELPGIKSFQGGVGGRSSTLLTRVSSLSLGPFTISLPLTELHFASGGAFASTLLAGNLGSQIFRNFTMTFDYTHRALYLEKSPDFGYSVPYNRTGVHLD